MPEPANRGSGLAQIPAPPSLVPIHILSLTFIDLLSPLPLLPHIPSAPSPKCRFFSPTPFSPSHSSQYS